MWNERLKNMSLIKERTVGHRGENLWTAVYE